MNNERDDKIVSQIDESAVADRFQSRLIALLTDVGVLSIGVLIFSVVLVLIVALFRLFHTGRYLVLAVSVCSDVISSFAWPTLAIALIILYRRYFLGVARELPLALRYFLQKSIRPAYGYCRDDDDVDETALNKLSPKTASAHKLLWFMFM